VQRLACQVVLSVPLDVAAHSKHTVVLHTTALQSFKNQVMLEATTHPKNAFPLQWIGNAFLIFQKLGHVGGAQTCAPKEF